MSAKTDNRKVLIGNSFPFSLIRSDKVVVESKTLDSLRVEMKGATLFSFWGHANTRALAESQLGVSLEPNSERPAITLSEKGLPMLAGETFDLCWLLSPDYPKGFRPAIGQEVGPEMISGWHVLKLTWKGR